MKIWEPRPPGTLGATPGLLRESFTFTLLLPSHHTSRARITICVRPSEWTVSRAPVQATRSTEPWARHGGCASETGWPVGNVVRVTQGTERAACHGRAGRTRAVWTHLKIYDSHIRGVSYCGLLRHDTVLSGT